LSADNLGGAERVPRVGGDNEGRRGRGWGMTSRDDVDGCGLREMASGVLLLSFV
jgi:hypothetical protein